MKRLVVSIAQEQQQLHIPDKLIFLPGASGNTSFWQPLADAMATAGERVILGYPGFGQAPADPDVAGIDDLVRMTLAHVSQPTALIAQSMGGVIAIRVALEKPELITHLVLTVTSGGIDTQALGASDWRTEFAAANPAIPDWFLTFKSDLSRDLGKITQPVLLLWGDADPISPVAVGQKLNELLPHATLHVIPGGTHQLAHDHADALAPLVDAHLAR